MTMTGATCLFRRQRLSIGPCVLSGGTVILGRPGRRRGLYDDEEEDGGCTEGLCGCNAAAGTRRDVKNAVYPANSSSVPRYSSPRESVGHRWISAFRSGSPAQNALGRLCYSYSMPQLLKADLNPWLGFKRPCTLCHHFRLASRQSHNLSSTSGGDDDSPLAVDLDGTMIGQ